MCRSWNRNKTRSIHLAKGRPVVNTERCKGCGLCVEACPQNILKMSAETNMQGVPFSVCSDEEKCTGCTFCAIMCPDSCIEVFREK
jgi:2-oxoglutarate ferredoxin oxidoreductase subunit delta